MATFWSCHLIVDRKLPDDRRRARDFIDTDFFVGKILLLYFFKWTRSTNANNFSCYYTHFGKMLDVSTTNDCTFTAYLLNIFPW